MNKHTEIAPVDQFPIAEATTFPHWPGPKPIVHAKLGISPNPSNSSQLMFTMNQEILANQTADDVNEMSRVARQYVLAHQTAKPRVRTLGPGPLRPETILLDPIVRLIGTPFDIKVHDKCWLLIELDRSVNWFFSPHRMPCHSKHADPPYVDGYLGHNICLRAVYPDGDVEADPTVRPRDPYYFIFFGVVHRTGLNSVPRGLGEHPMTFEVVFSENGLELPTSLDPDVGNDGPDEFPSPP